MKFIEGLDWGRRLRVWFWEVKVWNVWVIFRWRGLIGSFIRDESLKKRFRLELYIWGILVYRCYIMVLDDILGERRRFKKVGRGGGGFNKGGWEVVISGVGGGLGEYGILERRF